MKWNERNQENMKFGKTVVKFRIPILVIALVLLIPSAVGMVKTRINYDMLTYLPDDLETVQGQDILMEDFGKGAFSFIIVEGMPVDQVAALRERIAAVPHVDTALWYDSVMDISVPMEMLPEEIYEAFNAADTTMMAVFFDTSTSSDLTMEAIRQIRGIANDACFVSGMSAMVTDLKELCEKEEPVYVGLAVLFAVLAMILFLDSYLIPFVFLISIGMAILLNMGTNYFLGETSYLTKALSAVLQLAVTMDYSIFLWNSYNEEKEKGGDHKEAMAAAIDLTLTSVIGSSVTTIAGFIALCFMSFTLGRDLGIVMAKGVVLGVIGCVTTLPALILLLDKPLERSRHRSLIPPADGIAGRTARVYPVLIILAVIIAVPAYVGYKKTSQEVYYELSDSLPADLDYAVANAKLQETFDVASTHMLLIDAGLGEDEVRSMVQEIEQVNGISYVLGLESFVGPLIPEEILPEELTGTLKSSRYELILANSTYQVASDEVNEQIDSLEKIIKQYDPSGMLIGEASCTKDMIEVTDTDFKVVNAVSMAAIFIIIALVEKSVSLPFILVAVIELAIFINLGIPHYTGTSLPFIAPICISTIQLGATVDYAILMTTRYKRERYSGKDKRTSVIIALATSIPSIVVSAMGLFAATFGVAVYSNIDMIRSLCHLMARGAIISMLCVMLVLPALFLAFDPLICVTSLGFRPKKSKIREEIK